MSAIHCALCFHDRSGEYYRHAYATLLSIVANTREELIVHLLVDDTFSAEAEKAFRDLEKQHCLTVNIYKIPYEKYPMLAGAPEKFSVASCYRFFIHELIDADIVVYTDCDVIMNIDIRELYDIDISEYCIAAVHDPDALQNRSPDMRKKFAEFGTRDDNSFNSGVLLLNTQLMREKCGTGSDNVFLQTMAECVRAEIPLALADQDVLNIVFGDSGLVKYIDAKFNTMVHMEGRYFLTPSAWAECVLHFTMEKPWDVFFPAGLAYWKYYAMSPWGEDAFVRMAGLEMLKEYKYYRFAMSFGFMRKSTGRMLEIRRNGLMRFFASRFRHNHGRTISKAS